MRRDKRREDEGSQHRSSRTSRFRFKSGVEDPKDRKSRRPKRHGEREGHDRKRQRRDKPLTGDGPGEEGAAHPFPREPTNILDPGTTSDDTAFRTSLFDALADDEGAAYWESVYSQPIHVYSRPSVHTDKGGLEQMSDADYTAYVKTKMWERKHPEIVIERERSERRRKEEEEEKVRRREEFVRRKEQAAWERASGRTFVKDDEDEKRGNRKRYEYEFAGEKAWSTSNPISREQEQEFADAWARYLTAWDALKYDLLQERQETTSDDSKSKVKPSKRIPWPVISSKPVIKANIEDFMRRAPTNDDDSRMQALKAERVRWHPDKIQQRFGGAVDEGTMKVVTGVFQVVDGLVEQERKREA